MNLKLKAAGQTAGLIAVVFGTISLLNYFWPDYANQIVAAGILSYLVYLLYDLRYLQLKWKQDKE